MMGGKVYEVDFMFARPIDNTSREIPADALVLKLPSTDKVGAVLMKVPPAEEEVIKHCLDCLPWTTLAWSIHRGMRDIRVAYAKPTMDKFRPQLAEKLKQFVADKPYLLDSRGWNPRFVRESLGDMAASAILAGEGNSGDLVRVVTDTVLAMVGSADSAGLDEVNFWRRTERDLDLHGVVALTKLFVLEWSNEFDYQMYHELPISIYFG